MRSTVFSKSLQLLFVSLLLFFSHSAMQADKYWTGLVTSALDVIDEDLAMANTVTLQGGVSISALSQDVTVTLDNTVIVQGDDNGNARLYCLTNPTRTITVVIDEHLTFRGSSPDLQYNDLLIVVEGYGTTKFQVQGGRTVTLTRNGTVGGGARMYVIMKVESSGDIPTLQFEYLPGVATSAYVDIGARSLLGYLSDHAVSDTDKGEIIFDANTQTTAYNLILRILDRGNITISGRLIQDISRWPYKSLVLGNIVETLPAGCQAIFSVINSGGSAYPGGLIIECQNNTLCDLLADPWYNLGVRADAVDYNGSFSGIQYGFVLGNNGTLDIQSDAYVKYIGLRNDVCPEVVIPCGLSTTEPCCSTCCSTGCENNPIDWCDLPVDQVVKKRNPSAFFVDGYFDPESIPAQIKFSDRSALFFLSGVDCDGNVQSYWDRSFAIDPARISCGAGELIFDVEGFLNVLGSGNNRILNPSKMEILSLEVGSTSGPVLIGGAEPNFPIRTFNKDGNSDYIIYNKAYALINNYVNLCETWLVHSDVNHNIYEKNDVQSEPTYVGGETFQFNPSGRAAPGETVDRPKIVFYNSTLMVHDNIACTGVDLLVPNGLQCVDPECTIEEEDHMWVCPDSGHACIFRDGEMIFRAYDGMWPSGDHLLTCTDNLSKFIFYYNGYVVDSGSGRHMILGTHDGSTTCDCCTVVSKDAHLDIFQYTAITGTWCIDYLHKLELLTEANNSTINENITGNVTGQYSVQTIYLGNASNISIGTPTGGSPDPITHPWLFIGGNYFSLETRGGTIGLPETSSVTGEGGIFVDENGKISIDPHLRASVGTMVTKSNNGVVDLPRYLVLFDPRVGIAAWQPNMTEAAQRIIVAAGQKLSDYTLNWLAVTKDYANFTPFNVGYYSWPA